MLIDITLCENLFHTAPGTAFADIIIAGHRETWPIRSKRFRSFLRRCDYHATGEAASAAELLGRGRSSTGPNAISEAACSMMWFLASESCRKVSTSAPTSSGQASITNSTGIGRS
jgi:hypothetical protein